MLLEETTSTKTRKLAITAKAVHIAKSGGIKEVSVRWGASLCHRGLQSVALPSD
jgi:hypothetical protein